jgi:two-component system, OmpR family, sensor histidine kinase BaeS
VRFEANIDPSIPTFRFDYQKVQQIAANLLDNALEHTPSGGSVTLNCMPQPNGVEVSLTGALEDDQKILDDYEAVTRQLIARMVSLPRHPQTSEESLAVGLTIAKRLILAHHGKIWVEASPTGSRYAFLLPMDQG